MHLERAQIPEDLMRYFEPAACGECFVCVMVEAFRDVRRVLRDDGTCWIVIADSYNGGGGFSPDAPSNRARGRVLNRRAKPFESRKRAGHFGFKRKDRLGIPHRLVFALQADGWYWRDEIVWSKGDPMPESVRDRTTRSHEMIFLLSKAPRYYYDHRAVMEPTARSSKSRLAQDVANQEGSHRANGGAKTNGTMKAVGDPEWANKRSVWTVGVGGTTLPHYASMPPRLIVPCVKAGCPRGGVVLDPFVGTGTTLIVAEALGRSGVGLDLSIDYLALARRRIDRPHASLKVERPGVALPLFDAKV